MLQWRYIAGNNWGMCDDGTGAVGCGPQEEFRACADITIGDHAPAPPLRPIRPATKTTPRAKFTDATKTTPSTDIEIDEPFYDAPTRYLGALVIILTALLVVLCLMAAIYLYHYHGERVKQLMHWNKEHQQTQTKKSPAPIHMTQPPPPPNVEAPVPPPRAKRLSQTFNDIDYRR